MLTSARHGGWYSIDLRVVVIPEKLGWGMRVEVLIDGDQRGLGSLFTVTELWRMTAKVQQRPTSQMNYEISR